MKTAVEILKEIYGEAADLSDRTMQSNLTVGTVIDVMERYAVEKNLQKNNLVKCSNCDEMVEMISSGEFCPCCFC